jgi:hypothetical protein
MKPSLRSLVITAGSALVVAACDSPPYMGAFDPSFGEAVQHNIAVQTVNPQPENATEPPDFNGPRTAIAMGRYQADKVKQPPKLRTSDINIISTGGGN